MKYFIYDVATATEGQTLFKTSKPYLNGTLVVYVNGLLVDIGSDKDFIEVDNETINFNYPLFLNDEVVIISLFSSESLSVDVVSNNTFGKTEALYTKYSSKVKLMNNQKYKVKLSLKGQEPVEWHFTSKHNPYYSTIKKIRLDTGDLLDGVTDEQINYIIYINSKDANEYITDYIDTNSLSSTDTGYATIHNTGKKWVRYKTDMDFINSIYLSLCGVSGKLNKTLGDVIKIERQVTLPLLKDMLSRFQALFTPADEALKSSSSSNSSSVQSFIKGSKDYTYSQRGAF